MPSWLSKKAGYGQPKLESKGKKDRNAALPRTSHPVRTSYTSNAIEIPEKFLNFQASDHWEPLTIKKIDFAAEGLPEYSAASAWILENVLSPFECAELLKLAESSAQPGDNGDKWRPAMVNMGPNHEMMAPDYRNSDRIVWDHPEVMAQIMDRCFQAEGLREQLCEVVGNESCLGKSAAKVNEKWVFTRPNERMRFLRYREGQFFQRHCDGSYEHIKPEQNLYERSLFTLHLYLSSDEGLKGGSTAFFAGHNEAKRMEVMAKMGRVLIFQHRGLVHSGEMVVGGEKLTMRTDLMFKKDEAHNAAHVEAQ
ncbi:MAG: hypothetical protein M1828_003868 [Chrysothrix sp. TS-e1954]|nr:MAG: hypothetical protein M1828_003868 [Chrysothrix sp. TS-e1954]